MRDEQTITLISGAIQHLAPETLKPYENNPRDCSAQGMTQLEASLEEYGQVLPILLDADNTVVAGHALLQALKNKGSKLVATIQVTNLCKKRVRKLRLALNKLQVSKWNMQKLAIEFGGLIEFEDGFDNLGFQTKEIEDALSISQLSESGVADDVQPFIEEKAVTKVGDIWQLGEHRLLCGDAIMEASYQKLLGNQRARQIVTDPPFNVVIDGNVSGKGHAKHREFVMASGEMSQQEFTSFLGQSFRLMAEFSVDGALHFIFMDWRHIPEIMAAGLAVYSEFKQLCVWNKSNAGMGTLYRSKHELIFIFKNGRLQHANNFELGQSGRYRTNVWDYPGGSSFSKQRQEELAMHPTVKPVSMIMDAIRDCSKIGDIVLDPFAGSGTTIVAAEKTKRKAYCMELDPLYADVIIRRWQNLTRKDAIHVESGKTFAELAAERLATGAADDETA